jgi:hypothetical protein
VKLCKRDEIPVFPGIIYKKTSGKKRQLRFIRLRARKLNILLPSQQQHSRKVRIFRTTSFLLSCEKTSEENEGEHIYSKDILAAGINRRNDIMS